MKKYSDSTLKGFTKDFLIKTIRCLENNLEDCEERNENQFRILCKMDLERAKYRWHDLRKDPTDLPTHEEDVLVRFCKKYKVAKYINDFGEGYAWRSDVEGFCKNAVTGWREIEPFEVEE